MADHTTEQDQTSQLATIERVRRRIREVSGLWRTNTGSMLQIWRGRKSRHPVGRARWLKYAVLTVCLVIIALAVLDAPVGNFRGQWPPELMAWARATTDIGQSQWYLVPAGLFMIFVMAMDWSRLDRRRRWLLANIYTLAGYIFITVAASGLIATTLKRVIGRARPRHFEEHGLMAFDNFATNASFASFPSGHATTIGAVAAILALLFPPLRFAVLIGAVILGSTRILVGAHYPSDVIAGLAFGMWFAYFTALVFAARGLVFSPGADWLPGVRPSFRRFLSPFSRRNGKKPR